MKNGMAVLSAQPTAWLMARDPRVKLAWTLAISSLSVLVDSAVALGLLVCLSLGAFLLLRMRLRGWLTVGAILGLIAWGTLFSQAVFYSFEPRTSLVTFLPAFEVGNQRFAGVHFYAEGAGYGLLQSLRFLSMTLAGLTLCLSTSPERLLAALARLRLHAAVSFLLITALRTLPLLMQDWATVRRAAHLRGYQWRWRDAARIKTWKCEAGLLETVLNAALSRARNLAEAATARGFDSRSPRTYYPELRLTLTDYLILIGLLLLVAAVATLKMFLFAVDQGWLHRESWAALYSWGTRWL